MNSTVEVDVKLDIKEYAGFNFSNFARKFGGSPRGLKVFCAVLGILFVAVLTALLILKNQKQVTPFLYLLLGVIGFLILFLVILFVNISIASGLNFKNDRLLQSEQHYVFSKELIEVSSENTSVKVAWDKVKRIEVFKDCYAIFISMSQAYIIPKRCFTGAEGMKAFEEILATGVPGRKINI